MTLEQSVQLELIVVSTVFPWALHPPQSPLSSPLAEGRGLAQLSQAPRVSLGAEGGFPGQRAGGRRGSTTACT